MSRLKQLQDRKAALVASCEKLLDLGELTAEQEAEYNAHADDLKKVHASLERELALQEQIRSLGQKKLEDLPVEDEGKGKKGFQSLGHFLQAVARSGISGRRDERLTYGAAASGASEADDAYGGFLVEKDMAQEIFRIAADVGLLASRCKKVPVGPGSNGLKWNAIDETSRATGSRWGGVQVYMAHESDTVTASKPKLRRQSLELEKMMGLFYATDELLADASAMAGIATQAFSEEIAFKTDDLIVRGTGAGEPLGILNAGCTVSQAKETGQAGATVVKANVEKMWSRLHARSRANAVWLYNQEIEPQLVNMTMGVGTGGVPVYLPPGGLSSSPYSSLYGRPMLPIEHAAALGTVGDLMLVDLAQYLLIDKGGVESASSMHVRFIYDEMTFRFVYRVNGQPLWSSALTPFKGSATQSPFVTLATRS